MTPEKYYSIVKNTLGLRESGVPNVYFTSAQEVYYVPNPHSQTPEQRIETIERLKARMGIGWREEGGQ